MDYSLIKRSHLVAQHCQAAGIESVVISPGSRNAPLVMDFTAYDGFQCYSIVDERSAGFFALGLAQQSRRPVALVCTSGRAVVNYFPAITEAYYSQLPLVVISADRPEALIDRGEGQTINQRNVFGTHVLDSIHLSDNEPDINIASHALEKLLGLALTLSGPVHMNIPMDEPLYGVQQNPMNFDFDIGSYYKGLKPLHSDEIQLHERIIEYRRISRKMILIGALPPNTLDQSTLDHWQNDPSVVVLTETLANVPQPDFISGIDQVITDFPDHLMADFKPDLLISLGGMIVSKRIKKLLRAMEIDCHWHLGHERPNDTFFALKHHLRVDVDAFFNQVQLQGPQQGAKATSFKRKWLDLKTARLRGHESFLTTAPFSDFTVHQGILSHLPEHINLQVANSASIRYAQLFPANATHQIYCNRGTSGIEGSMSTAIGTAACTERQTVFVTGDLSFFYDINALWQNYTPKSFRVIIINNQGGGIFRILPGAKQVAPFETFLETPHQRNAALMAKEFGFDYVGVHDMDQLKVAFGSFFGSSDAPRIMEVFTPSGLNDTVLNGYFDYLKANTGPLSHEL